MSGKHKKRRYPLYKLSFPILSQVILFSFYNFTWYPVSMIDRGYHGALYFTCIIGISICLVWVESKPTNHIHAKLQSVIIIYACLLQDDSFSSFVCYVMLFSCSLLFAGSFICTVKAIDWISVYKL